MIVFRVAFSLFLSCFSFSSHSVQFSNLLNIFHLKCSLQLGTAGASAAESKQRRRMAQRAMLAATHRAGMPRKPDLSRLVGMNAPDVERLDFIGYSPFRFPLGAGTEKGSEMPGVGLPETSTAFFFGQHHLSRCGRVHVLAL